MTKPAWQFEHSIECAANRSFVWSFWIDVSNWERLEGKAVEWIRLHGPFAEGTSGETKMPGQHPTQWRITQLEFEQSATIDMPLDGAVFLNRIIFESISMDRTRIIQHMSLIGDKASELADGMDLFEKNAPQGLLRLARSIESAFNHS